MPSAMMLRESRCTPEGGGTIAICVASDIDDIIPKSRQGLEMQRNLLAVVSVDRGMIVTGYGISSLDQTTVPEDARWLN